eukprot:s2561_g15.t4
MGEVAYVTQRFRSEVFWQADSLYPIFCRTSMKSSTVRGPEETKRENCWCVRGSKGERYRVEFYRSDTGAATVSWLREQ